jgi:uncharacterized protein (TIGR00255 family)
MNKSARVQGQKETKPPVQGPRGSKTPVQGMTGFGSAERGEFRVEVRSLNHRFLEVNVRMPHRLVEHEMHIRKLIKDKFARGRFDVFVNLNGKTLAGGLDQQAAKEVYALLNSLKKEMQMPGEIGMSELLHLKEFFTTEAELPEAGPLYESLNSALADVEKMRVEEGRMLSEDILAHAENLSRLHKEAQALLPTALAGMKERFTERMKALMGETGYEEPRLLQEAAILAEKADIAEELARIAGHLSQIRKLFENGEKIGRELDFILQELNREANTIGSKMEEVDVINKVIEFKTEVERIRQQAQNLQ